MKMSRDVNTNPCIANTRHTSTVVMHASMAYLEFRFFGFLAMQAAYCMCVYSIYNINYEEYL